MDRRFFRGMSDYEWYDGIKTIIHDLTWETFMKNWHEFFDEMEARKRKMN